MKKIMQRFFLQNINNYWHWIILAIIIKALFFAFMLSQNMPETGTGIIYTTGGDTDSYIEPIENLISKGSYSPDFRMPGYGAFYFLLRLLLSKTNALNLLALIQLLLSSLSVYFLALIARDIFKRDNLFYISFYGYLLSTYTSIFDIYILTESIAVSGLIFAVFCFVRGMNKNSAILLFFSGCFLTWCIFLKPFLLPLMGLFMAVLILSFLRNAGYNHIKAVKTIIVFLLPFLLIEGAWTSRNYRLYGKIIPLQKSWHYPATENDKIMINLFYFMRSWGGDLVWWNPEAEINWFGYIKNTDNVKKQVRDIKFPDYIYTSRFNYDSLVSVKNYMALSKDETLSMDERNKFRQLAADRLREYADSIKKEKPYWYYIYAPSRLLKKFLFHSGTYNLFNKTVKELNIVELAFKLSMTLIYLYVAIAGLIGTIILFFKECRINNKFLITAIPLYIIIFFAVAYRVCEYRYFVPAYPFMLVCAAYSSNLVYNALVRNEV